MDTLVLILLPGVIGFFSVVLGLVLEEKAMRKKVTMENKMWYTF